MYMMTEKDEEKKHNTAHEEDVEREHLINVENEESGIRLSSPRTFASSIRRPTTLISTITRPLLLTLCNILRTTHSTSTSHLSGSLKPTTFKSILATIFGYPRPLPPPTQTTWLDGLRGMAALLVLIYHWNLDTFAFSTEAPYLSPGTHIYDLWRLPYLRLIWCSGHVQVGIFFVLSGMVLSWSSLSHIRNRDFDRLMKGLGSMVFRRWMRLFIPCFLIGGLSLVQFWLGWVELPMVERQSSFLGQTLDYVVESERFANPFHLDRNQWEVLNKYNATMWTMPVEWAGSLCVFVILIMIGRIQHYWRRTVVLVVMTGYCCLSAKWNYWLFSTGILLGDYVKEAGGFEVLSERMGRRARMFWVLVLLIGGWMGGIPGKREWYERPGYEWTDAWIPQNWQDIEGGQRYFWCWSGIMIIWGLAHFAVLKKFFERSFCRYLGKISFMLYLTHRMVGTILGPTIRKHIADVVGTRHRVPEQDVELVEIRGFFWNIVAYLLMWVFMLPLALVLANWCTILVDEPSVRFAKWVDDKFINGFEWKPERRAGQLS